MAESIIGSRLSVCGASNASYLPLQGEVVDETRSTVSIRTDAGQKRILKRGTVFSINGNIIPGVEMEKRLEDRIKKRSSSQWKR